MRTWKGAGAVSERLTKRKDYGCACWNGDQNLVTHSRYMKLLDALAKYEDVLFDADGGEVISLARLHELAEAEREGRVVVLPCKVADHIFTISTDGVGNIDGDEIWEDTIYEFYIHKGGIGISIDPYDGHIGNYTHEGCDTGTRRIYLNKANAESALAGELAAANAGKGENHA